MLKEKVMTNLHHCCYTGNIKNERYNEQKMTTQHVVVCTAVEILRPFFALSSNVSLS